MEKVGKNFWVDEGKSGLRYCCVVESEDAAARRWAIGCGGAAAGRAVL